MSPEKTMPAQQHGLLVLNKPEGPTSTKCLEAIKKKLGQRKIGHAGTLDPMARGVLLVLLGQGTKLAPYLGEGWKTYLGQLRFGQESDTFDRTGTIVAEHAWDHLRVDDVRSGIQAWQEMTEQAVPAYSAAKHKGTPMYSLARQGKAVPEKTKPVHIDLAEVLHVELPVVAFRVRCSQGTYIRSLAHSLGKRLDCGAVLSELVREESHPFSLAEAVDLQTVLDDPAGFPERVKGLAEALPHWPRFRLQPDQVRAVQNGHWLRCQEVAVNGSIQEEDKALFLNGSGEPVALVQARTKDGALVWSILRGLAGQNASRGRTATAPKRQT
jgi:tRNA pseudouridine55 synthase